MKISIAAYPYYAGNAVFCEVVIETSGESAKYEFQYERDLSFIADVLENYLQQNKYHKRLNELLAEVRYKSRQARQKLNKFITHKL